MKWTKGAVTSEELEERKRRLGLSEPTAPSFEEEESTDFDVSSLKE